MPCCCVAGCHNRAERGYKLYKLPQGNRNNARRKLWIQNINRKDPLPIHAYVCQDHFTDDQFELGRADHRKLLKWNAVPTLFSCKENRQEKFSKQETAVLESNNKSEEAIREENLNFELKQKTEVKIDNSTNNNSDEIATLKCELNVCRQEIRTLRTIISQLQAIIERLVGEDCTDDLLPVES